MIGDYPMNSCKSMNHEGVGRYHSRLFTQGMWWNFLGTRGWLQGSAIEVVKRVERQQAVFKIILTSTVTHFPIVKSQKSLVFARIIGL